MPLTEAKLRSLKGDYAFRRLRKGKSGGGKWLNLRVLPNQKACVQVGIVANKKVGKATVRNLLRRRTKEALRAVLKTKPIQPFYGNPPAFDVVIVLHPEAADATYWQLKAGLQQALSKAGVLK